MGKTETLPHCVYKKALGFNLTRSRGYSHKSHVAWNESRSSCEGMKHPAETLCAIRVHHGLASARIVKSDTRGARSDGAQTGFVSGRGRGSSYRWEEYEKIRAERLEMRADAVLCRVHVQSERAVLQLGDRGPESQALNRTWQPNEVIDPVSQPFLSQCTLLVILIRSDCLSMSSASGRSGRESLLYVAACPALCDATRLHSSRIR